MTINLSPTIIYIISGYAVILILVYTIQEKFIFHPEKLPADFKFKYDRPFKEVFFDVERNVRINGLHFPVVTPKGIILYFHGNGANAADRAPRIQKIRERGFGVFYLNNRGYGGSGGRPTEKDNITDAIAAYDHLIGLGMPAGKIVAYGESLGSGQAVRLGAARPVAAVVLEAPLTSTIDVARSTYFWLPLGLLITDKYNNERNIRLVKAPVLVLHGAWDAVIPVEMGWRVYRAANEPKRIELFPHGTHDDLFDQGAWEKTQAFLDSLVGAR